VLGASGLIITGVSLGIAIFAFWGYRNIKKEASELAAEKSKEMVENKIEIGEFDQVIYKAVEKAIYRDILSTEDFPEDEGVNDESL
jgi:peroxiredoxin family protein